MSIENLYASISGVSDIISIEETESYGGASRNCNITCDSTTLDIGDSITVDMGYDSSHGTFFTGYVKSVTKSYPEGSTVLSCFDVLIKAKDYFLVSADPNAPWTRTNISAEDLIGDLLNEAGITSYSGDISGFTFTEPSFNLTNISDAVKSVADIIAWHVWSDETGTVHFANRPPYVLGSDTPTKTFTTGSSGNIKSMEYVRSDDDLRNKVVVYGKDPIVSSASTSSPYLPAGYYKTAVIASPLITQQSMADSAASYNLTLYNRLTKTVTGQVLGDYSLHVNDVATITESHTEVSGDWILYSVSHRFAKDGFVTRVTFRS